MRKTKLIIAIMLFVFASTLSASTYLDGGSFRVRAYCDYTFSIVLEENLTNMPFDVQGDQVQPKTDEELLKSPGLPIGTWSIFTTLASASLSVQCSSLQHTNDASMKIPYNLQVSYPTTTTSANTTYAIMVVPSGGEAKTVPLMKDTAGYYDVKQANFYVRMQQGYDAASLDTMGANETLSGGNYQGVITMTMTAS
jgi:hypothetical protein